MGSDLTTTALLDAAEQLFADRGFEAVSIREITRAADVNVAAVHYHFGDKQAILRAVTSRIVDPMNDRRLRLLELALAASSPEPAPVTGVLEAFIRPDVETLQSLQRRGPTVAHFLGRIYGDQTAWIQEMAQDQFRATADRFLNAIAAALPHLAREDIQWRLSRVVAVILHTFATWPAGGMDDDSAERTIRRLVNFSAAAMAANPVP